MKITIPFLAAAVLSAAASAATAQEAAKPEKPEKYKVGDVLRDAKLTDMSGREASLLALTKGRPTVINFFGRH